MPKEKTKSETWETVAEWTSRLQVPGGWLYSVQTHSNDDISEAVVFVPDLTSTLALDRISHDLDDIGDTLNAIYQLMREKRK